MAKVPAGFPVSSAAFPTQHQKNSTGRERQQNVRFGAIRSLALLPLAAFILIAPLLLAQGNPRVTATDPSSGKVDDTVTLTGENLGKANVTEVYLSDDKNDYKATVVDQADGKITMKVPKVKTGNYNVSLQVNGNIYIQPIRFKVEE